MTLKLYFEILQLRYISPFLHKKSFQAVRIYHSTNHVFDIAINTIALCVQYFIPLGKYFEFYQGQEKSAESNKCINICKQFHFVMRLQILLRLKT